MFPLDQAFFTEEYTEQHQEDRDKLLRLKDLIAWQVRVHTTVSVLALSSCPADAKTFVFVDPAAGRRDRPPREESERRPASVPRAHGGVLQAAEEESGEGVRSERAGETQV